MSFLQVHYISLPLQRAKQQSNSSRMSALRHLVHWKQQQQQSVLPCSQRMPSTTGESNGEEIFE